MDNLTLLRAKWNFSTDNNSPVDHIHYIFNEIALPIVCIFGILGNFLNLAVLTRKQLQNSMDRMEKSAHLGLVALAISDFLFCICALPYAFLDNQKHTFFETESIFLLYYKFGHMAVLNTLLDCSTWLTVVMASARYLAICHPLHARGFIDLTGTKIAITLTFCMAVLINLPWFWQSEILTRQCSTDCKCYTITWGTLFMNEKFEYSYQIIWALLGVFIPTVLLTICNICLILALRQSMNMQRKYRVNRPKTDSGHRITPTLIVIVILFMTLVVPSEIIKFVLFIFEKQSIKMSPTAQYAFRSAAIITNFMQLCNFAINFILYCILNVHFRNTVMYIFCCKWRGKTTSSGKKKHGQNRTMSTLMTDIETDM